MEAGVSAAVPALFHSYGAGGGAVRASEPGSSEKALTGKTSP